eukprot:1158206-Pelagomonas_calceolata.AAC.2
MSLSVSLPAVRSSSAWGLMEPSCLPIIQSYILTLRGVHLHFARSAGQQRVSPDGALLPFKKTIQPFRPPSSASILSSKVSSA